MVPSRPYGSLVGSRLYERIHSMQHVKKNWTSSKQRGFHRLHIQKRELSWIFRILPTYRSGVLSTLRLLLSKTHPAQTLQLHSPTHWAHKLTHFWQGSNLVVLCGDMEGEKPLELWWMVYFEALYLFTQLGWVLLNAGVVRFVWHSTFK